MTAFDVCPTCGPFDVPGWLPVEQDGVTHLRPCETCEPERYHKWAAGPRRSSARLGRRRDAPPEFLLAVEFYREAAPLPRESQRSRELIAEISRLADAHEQRTQERP